MMNRRAAAEALGCSISRLKRLERVGRLKPIRIGGGRDVHYAACAMLSGWPAVMTAPNNTEFAPLSVCGTSR
jgi:hypothetical protein